MKVETTIKVTFTSEECRTISLAASHLMAIYNNMNYEDNVIINNETYNGKFIEDVVDFLSIFDTNEFNILCEIEKD